MAVVAEASAGCLTVLSMRILMFAGAAHCGQAMGFGGGARRPDPSLGGGSGRSVSTHVLQVTTHCECCVCRGTNAGDSRRSDNPPLDCLSCVKCFWTRNASTVAPQVLVIVGSLMNCGSRRKYSAGSLGPSEQWVAHVLEPHRAKLLQGMDLYMPEPQAKASGSGRACAVLLATGPGGANGRERRGSWPQASRPFIACE